MVGRIVKLVALVAGVLLVGKLARADFATEDMSLFPHAYDPFCER